VNPTSASEFPNDNPGLHDGAIWICRTPCSRPRAIVRPVQAAKPIEAAPVVEPVSLPEPQPESTVDGYAELVAVLVKVALETGATRAAAVLPTLLAGEAVTADGIGEENLGCLVARGFAERAGSIVLLSTEASAVAAGWRAMLRGQDADLSGCESTLDSWCAGLLAAAAGTPSRADELRRELRRHGVAAFGLLAQAA
jgi:hypothetical protein